MHAQALFCPVVAAAQLSARKRLSGHRAFVTGRADEAVINGSIWSPGVHGVEYSNRNIGDGAPGQSCFAWKSVTRLLRQSIPSPSTLPLTPPRAAVRPSPLYYPASFRSSLLLLFSVLPHSIQFRPLSSNSISNCALYSSLPEPTRSSNPSRALLSRVPF